MTAAIKVSLDIACFDNGTDGVGEACTIEETVFVLLKLTMAYQGKHQHYLALGKEDKGSDESPRSRPWRVSPTPRPMLRLAIIRMVIIIASNTVVLRDGYQGLASSP